MSSISMLPEDLVLEIMARIPKYKIIAGVPKDFHQNVVSCVCKRFRDIIRSPSVIAIRRRLNTIEDSLYLCFGDSSYSHYIWYVLRSVKSDLNRFVCFPDAPRIRIHEKTCIITVGPMVYLFCGNAVYATRLWIYDSQSKEVRAGPAMRVEMMHLSVGLVGRKIYVTGAPLDLHFGTSIIAESYDLDTQTWGDAPTPMRKPLMQKYYPAAIASIDKKLYGLSATRTDTYYYDTTDGTCEFFEMPSISITDDDDSLKPKIRSCVIDNVLYIFHSLLGLMWYDSLLAQWRPVSGDDSLQQIMNLIEDKVFRIAEYHGKLALVWLKEGDVGVATNQIWGTTIALATSEIGVHGTAEQDQLLATIPRRYMLRHFFSVLG